MNIEPNQEDIERAVEILSKLEPGKLPIGIFIEVARWTVTPIIEVVPVRFGQNNKVQVLLTEREASDPIWGGMLHTPGTVVRASDIESNNNDAFKRILDGELNGVLVSVPVFVENIFHKVKRGTEQAQVYYVEVLADPTIGRFYDADNLPENVVDSQLDFINHAVTSFIGNSKFLLT